MVQEGYIEAGSGVRLFYRLVGTSGDTVIVLHGGPGFTMEYFAKDLEPLWFVPFFGDSSAAGRSKGDFCAGTPESRRNKIVSVDRFVAASLGDWDWTATLRRVTAPTLVIHGTADVLPVAGAREWAAVVPQARLLLLERIGHFPYLEAPERFFAAVDTFLRGSWPAEAQPAAPE